VERSPPLRVSFDLALKRELLPFSLHISLPFHFQAKWDCANGKMQISGLRSLSRGCIVLFGWQICVKEGLLLQRLDPVGIAINKDSHLPRETFSKQVWNACYKTREAFGPSDTFIGNAPGAEVLLPAAHSI